MRSKYIARLSLTKSETAAAATLRRAKSSAFLYGSLGGLVAVIVYALVSMAAPCSGVLRVTPISNTAAYAFPIVAHPVALNVWQPGDWSSSATFQLGPFKVRWESNSDRGRPGS